MRRYELMLVLRPDAPDERASAVIDRTTRYVVASGGQIVKVAPWGRRRLAYPIDRYREGSYHIVVFESPAEAIAELERSLQITEDVLRYLVTRTIKPVRTRRDANTGAEVEDIDVDKYLEYASSMFDQMLDSLGFSFDEILGSTTLDAFWS